MPLQRLFWTHHGTTDGPIRGRGEDQVPLPPPQQIHTHRVVERGLRSTRIQQPLTAAAETSKTTRKLIARS